MFQRVMKDACGVLFMVAVIAFSGVDGDCGDACLLVGTLCIIACGITAYFGGVSIYGKNDTDGAHPASPGNVREHIQL